jgi:hypothetical protein
LSVLIHSSLLRHLTQHRVFGVTVSSAEEADIIKVIVELHLDLSEESDNAIRVAFSVAEELLDKHNIWVEIIPIHVWLTDPIEQNSVDLPKIFINGKLRFIGRAPTRKELAEAIREHINIPPRKATTPETVYTRVFNGGLPQVAEI